jgi:transcriptional regulator with XRE-family HTH domain
MAAWNEEIRQCRQGRGLTQEEFARELARVAWEQQHVQVGVDAAMVSKWERGTKQPSRQYQRLLGLLIGGDPTGAVGSSGYDSRLGFDYAQSSVSALDTVDRLGRADVERRAFLRTALSR